MNVLDLFSGIGGFSLGLERAGMRTVAFCEASPHARAILEKHWPNVPCYDDVRTLTADRLTTDGISVDVICGGFPCQDLSSAGKQAGIRGERSGLWSEYARLIDEIRPSYIIVENVAALLSGPSERPGEWFGIVLGDLAALGYDAEWHCIPASAIGARHRRDRIWIVANPRSGRCSGPGRRQVQQPWRAEAVSASKDLADADSERKLQSEGREQDERRWIGDGGQDVADAKCGRLQGGDVECARPTAVIATEIGRYCRGRQLGETWRIEPDVGRVAYGLPAAMDRIERLGNAVVPQIPEIIGRAIMTSLALSSPELS